MTNYQQPTIYELRSDLIFEVVKAIGLPQKDFYRRLFTPFFRKPIDRFSKFWSFVDKKIHRYGFSKGANYGLKRLVSKTEFYGDGEIPKEGPLLVIANHPGTYDSLCIAAQLPRDDVKIVSSTIPFLSKFTSLRKHLIFTTRNTQDRMITIRNAIDHLKSGGTLIIYPSGHIDPEPSEMPGAIKELNNWSKSLEIFLKKVPETAVQVGIVSRVLLKKYINHPLSFVRKTRLDRQRVSEFIQVIKQMAFEKKFDNIPLITFAKTFHLKDISPQNEVSALLPYAIEQAKKLMTQHLNYKKTVYNR